MNQNTKRVCGKYLTHCQGAIVLKYRYMTYVNTELALILTSSMRHAILFQINTNHLVYEASRHSEFVFIMQCFVLMLWRESSSDTRYSASISGFVAWLIRPTTRWLMIILRTDTAIWDKVNQSNIYICILNDDLNWWVSSGNKVFMYLLFH